MRPSATAQCSLQMQNCSCGPRVA
ncbi:MAG: hypothetical protein DMG11_26755 [Acidobacteria bacterium]|nr:MAG: hypothetical protein DMG11_26755 [Acidobacteriota bacterium]